MKLYASCFFLLLSSACFAQQYLIKYDMQSQQTKYYKIQQADTAKIKNIDLRKNGRILLQVNNYNPFYWNAKVTAFKNPVDEEVGYGDAFNPFSVLAGGMGDLMNSLPKLDLPKSRGEISRENMDDVTYQYLSTAAAYAQNYEDLQALNAKLEELQIAKLQLTELKFNIQKKEGDIKREAEKTVTKVLSTSELDLGNVLKIGKGYNSNLNNALQNASSLLSNLQQQQKTVNNQAVYEDRTLREIGENAGSSFKQLDRLRSAQAANPNLLLDEVAAVAKLYNEISTANFQFSYAVKNEEDISDLKLELYPKAEIASKDTVVQYFELNRKKSIRIRNSVGVSFSYFDANNRNYYIGADSVIRKGEKDLFTPLLSTFIHFYAGKTQGVKWGGAFGFGIPLQGEKKDVNFLLGLTAAIGKNEPILVTLGAAGTKVNKLAFGYSLGGKTSETDPAKLTTSGYGVGGFLGITFNLNNLGLGKK